jgi:hypothetical protein
MNIYRTGIFLLASGLLLGNASPMRGQAAPDPKAKSEAHPDSKAEPRTEKPAEKITPLRVQVLLTEYEGDKKVKSLPYVSDVDADRNGYQFTKLRTGTKVPVYNGKEWQYIDVGTAIDYRATHTEGGAFRVELVIERSWVDSEVLVPMPKGASDDPAGQLKEPVIRQFKTEVEVTLRDGQSTESTVSTDPITGKIMKIEVSLAVLK